MESQASVWRRSMDVPNEYRGHDLVVDRVFFVLPEGLLKALDDAIAEPHKLASGIEIALSRICGDLSQHVGFGNALPIVYPYLRRRPVTSIVLDEAAHEFLIR